MVDASGVQMLANQQLVVRYFFSVVRLMIAQFKNMRKKQRTKVERAGELHLIYFGFPWTLPSSFSMMENILDRDNSNNCCIAS